MSYKEHRVRQSQPMEGNGKLIMQVEPREDDLSQNHEEEANGHHTQKKKSLKKKVSRKSSGNIDLNSAGSTNLARESNVKMDGKPRSFFTTSMPKALDLSFTLQDDIEVDERDVVHHHTEAKLYYDFAIVVPKVSETYMGELKQRIENAGFVTQVFESARLSGAKAVLYLQIALPLSRCHEFADATKCPARLDPAKLRESCAQLRNPILFDKRAADGRTFKEVTQRNGYWPPFLYIYGDYRSEKKDLYLPYLDHTYHRIQLRILALSADLPWPLTGAGLSIREMSDVTPGAEYKADSATGEGPRIASMMLLHDAIDDEFSLRHSLYTDWILNWKSMVQPWRVPMHRIREYFGDQLGFYFLLTSTFATHCIPIGLLGLLIMLFQLGENDSNKERQAPIVIFAPGTVIAMSAFLVHFRRKQATYAKEWGVYAWTSSRVRTRKQFKGMPQVDPVDGHIILHFSNGRRLKRQMLTWGLTTMLLFIVMSIISSIFGLRAWCLNQPSGSFWNVWGVHLCTLLNILQVHVLNFLYETVAVRLTCYENWKTNPEYTNQLITKLFIFQFLNTFAPMYYIAFLKWHLEPERCDNAGGCLQELYDTVWTIFLSGACVCFLVKLVVPILKQKAVKRRTGGVYAGEGSEVRIRRQFNELIEYDAMQGPIVDCMELVKNFAYMSCFGAAFPASPFIVLSMMIVLLRQDGYKFLFVHQRIISMEVHSIGVWEHIIYFIILVAIPTSMGLMVFTAEIFWGLSLVTRWLIFFMGSNTMYLIMRILFWAFPAEFPGVCMQLKRQEVYNSRVIYDKEAEIFPDEAKAAPDATESLLLAEHVNLLTRNV